MAIIAIIIALYVISIVHAIVIVITIEFIWLIITTLLQLKSTEWLRQQF